MSKRYASFTQKGRKREEGGGNHTVKVMTCVLSLVKVLTYASIHVHVAIDQENIVRVEKRGSAFCVLLPLHSTKGDMQTIRTIDIGRRKQGIICTYKCTCRISNETQRIPVQLTVR